MELILVAKIWTILNDCALKQLPAVIERIDALSALNVQVKPLLKVYLASFKWVWFHFSLICWFSLINPFLCRKMHKST